MFVRLAFLPILAGIVLGVIAPLLAYVGNPENMGICTTCFVRDIAGALKIHQAESFAYLRPEIFGLVLGALGSAIFFGEFNPRGGSSPVARFLLGFFAMSGALVFLGCPLSATLRFSGGDWSAIAGIFGFVAGVGVGSFFLKQGFSLGKSKQTSPIVGYLFASLAFFLLVVGLFKTLNPEWNMLNFSQKGIASIYAPWLISLCAGLLLGALFQKSRFCMVTAFRDLFILRDLHMMQGIVAFIFVAFFINIFLNQFNGGFIGQNAVHNEWLWNFLGMLLCGLALTLAGGCPIRQLILSGEGDNDAGIFLIGMLVGAAFAYNFNFASSVDGASSYAPFVILVGLAFCGILAYLSRVKS
ncbi:YedE-related selenium metabolism membrane protein [Helicobacter monodelphidis]|uniref:YedE family putative selenium transporter n=1 Tax=Helicobacter sp. 15-1451 TaxID=2004995 RepID=UPI000DCC8481|nr:YedE family putative selenium transporter [Helicobacter sp. 15-1451]RAX58183.1 YedE-related selenium metabolism membrane protein [Helicobacter sp. 15-1451]